MSQLVYFVGLFTILYLSVKLTQWSFEKLFAVLNRKIHKILALSFSFSIAVYIELFIIVSLAVSLDIPSFKEITIPSFWESMLYLLVISVLMLIAVSIMGLCEYYLVYRKGKCPDCGGDYKLYEKLELGSNIVKCEGCGKKANTFAVIKEETEKWLG